MQGKRVKDIPMHNLLHKVLLKRTCRKCNDEVEITVQFKDHADWFGGKQLEKAFPYLTEDEQRMLQTGYCGDCYAPIDQIFDFTDLDEEGSEEEGE